MLKDVMYRILFLAFCIAASLSVSHLSSAHAHASSEFSSPLGDDEHEFKFMGQCPNGAAYSLVAYERHVNGANTPFCDYEGPVGKGTVKSRVQPRVMAACICRELAEISDDPNLD